MFFKLENSIFLPPTSSDLFLRLKQLFPICMQLH